MPLIYYESLRNCLKKSLCLTNSNFVLRRIARDSGAERFGGGVDRRAARLREAAAVATIVVAVGGGNGDEIEYR